MGVRTNDDAGPEAAGAAAGATAPQDATGSARGAEAESATGAAADGPGAVPRPGAEGASADADEAAGLDDTARVAGRGAADAAAGPEPRPGADAGSADDAGTESRAEATPGPEGPAGLDTPRGGAPVPDASGAETRPEAPAGGTAAPEGSAGLEAPETDASGPDGVKKGSRRPPAVTRDTARPEGGGRAAPGDAPAPARQWPLLTVLSLTGLGLLIVGIDAFADAFRVGTILVGVALITGGVLRRVLPSVGMLAVRSRFTDMITYGTLGIAIVLLALVAQPEPWLDVPFLEDAVHFTVRSSR
ncbi:DUF3017 domain-containing protein [Streptomyces sp. NPDC002889]|uniref:DUF3017 domain-containing protein n=1 Tax=Streptomyces sp. NPDC002889 TaxID=3364669 RepID=UPI00368BC563